MINRTAMTLEMARDIYEKFMHMHKPLPEPDEFGMIKMNYQELRSRLKEEYKMGWSGGVCYMLASVNIDSKNNHE